MFNNNNIPQFIGNFKLLHIVCIHAINTWLCFARPRLVHSRTEEEEEEGTHTPTHTEEIVAFNKAQGRHIIIHHFPTTYLEMESGGDRAKTVLPVPRILDCDTYYVRVCRHLCAHTWIGARDGNEMGIPRGRKPQQKLKKYKMGAENML